jgi:hypothetical protein
MSRSCAYLTSLISTWYESVPLVDSPVVREPCTQRLVLHPAANALITFGPLCLEGLHDCVGYQLHVERWLNSVAGLDQCKCTSLTEQDSHPVSLYAVAIWDKPHTDPPPRTTAMTKCNSRSIKMKPSCAF